LFVALAGGVGAARFLEGVIRVVPQEEVIIIGNVGDDIEVYGLHVSPDLDIVAYTLAGLVDPNKGWGFRGDTFRCQDALRKFGYATWFNIGDRDMATHLHRTQKLSEGKRLSQVTEDLVRSLGLRVKLLPSTDDQLTTYVTSRGKRMHFQEYMVKRRTKPRVDKVIFEGTKSAKPAKGVLESIATAKGVLVCPSNPIVSIGAVLAVPKIRTALKRTKAKVLAISPIIGGKTVKGPADKLMKSIGIEPSAVGVAECYRDFLDTLIIDRVDRKLAPKIEALGIRAIVAQTLMKTYADKTRLARLALSELES
jgi:LPPG:FO 2-phospho-L-lactate transferase